MASSPISQGETLKKNILQDEVNSILWKACDTFRGTVDPSEYKNYILVILFIKYVSKKYAGQENPPIVVPEGSSFADLVALKGSKDIGDQMNRIIAKLAAANNLKGVIDTADFNDTNKIGRGKEMQDRLSTLIATFEDPVLDMHLSETKDMDMLGNAVSSFIDGISLKAGKGSGEFFTPIIISELLTKLVEPQLGEKIYDPACGSGSLLLKCANYIGNENCSIYGQEVNVSTRSLAVLNALLHGVSSAEFKLGDTLCNPLFLENNDLMKFDVVVTNPPFGLKRWGYEEWKNDKFGRNIGGIPPRKSGDYAWIQHVVASLKKVTGRAAIVVPAGVLFRGGSEGEIRKYIIENDILEAVISLGPSLMYYTGVAINILILRWNKKPFQKGNILLLNAATLFEKEAKRNTLNREHLKQILNWYQAYKNVPGAVKIVTFPEIAINSWNLNLPHYIRPEPGKLLEHAITSIQLGIQDYETGDEDRIFSSIRNLYAGMLLLFKEKLLRLSPEETEESLIKAKIVPLLENGKITFKGSGKKTVDVYQIKERFDKLGIKVDWKQVQIIQEKRNDIEHYYTTDRKYAILGVISSTFMVIRDFIQDELKEDPKDLIGIEFWQKMLDASDFYEDLRNKCLAFMSEVRWENDLFRDKISELHCLTCNSLLIKPTNNEIKSNVNDQYFTCESCGQTVSYAELVEAHLANILMQNTDNLPSLENE